MKLQDKGNTEMGDDWREWKEDAQKIRKISREGNSEAAKYYSETYNIPLVEYNNGMQLSFQKNGLRLDYFPTSDKIFIGKKWWAKADLETKLKEHFKI